MRVLPAALLGLVLFLSLAAQARAFPEEVRASVYLLNVGGLDVSAGTFTADFYLSLHCPSTCPAIDYTLMNGRVATSERIRNEPNEKLYRLSADLNSPMDMERFPFDSQTLQIIVEEKMGTERAMNITANNQGSGVDPSLTIGGWETTGWSSKAGDHAYGAYNETHSRYEFDLTIARPLAGFLKTLLPALLIIIIVLYGFTLNVDKTVPRLIITFSGLAASLLLHIFIMLQAPTAQLTFADKFMLLTYLIITAVLILNVLMVRLQETSKKDVAEKLLKKKAKYVILAVVAALYVVLFLVFF